MTENKPKAHPGRMQLPSHLRREVILLQPDMDVTGLKIGDEISEVLDYTPGELYVKQYIRPKYVQPLTELTNTVVTASLPGRLLEKCMAGEGLLSQIIVDKYVDHLPLHRQLQRFQRAGVSIAQSTINDWVKVVLTHLTALYEVHKKLVLDSGYLHADETPLKVMDDIRRVLPTRATTGYIITITINWCSLITGVAEDGKGPDDILKDFKGYLQTDGYVVYDDFDKREGITLMHCMAHARRKFSDALANDRQRAEYALSLLQQLYAIERRIKQEELSAEATVQLRQQQAVPVLQTWKHWMTQEYAKVLPKSLLDKLLVIVYPGGRS